jgi:hypothetical protein
MPAPRAKAAAGTGSKPQVCLLFNGRSRPWLRRSGRSCRPSRLPIGLCGRGGDGSGRRSGQLRGEIMTFATSFWQNQPSANGSTSPSPRSFCMIGRINLCRSSMPSWRPGTSQMRGCGPSISPDTSSGWVPMRTPCTKPASPLRAVLNARRPRGTAKALFAPALGDLNPSGARAITAAVAGVER